MKKLSLLLLCVFAFQFTTLSAFTPAKYSYDLNGNMTQDLNNGIENIEYNVLNLPKLFTFANGGTIRYTYSAAGGIAGSFGGSLIGTSTVDWIYGR